MDITLMTHIENDLIFRHMKHSMQRKRQFHHTEIGSQMSAVY